MTDVVPYSPADDPIHAWVALMRPAAELARGIHETDFVPKSLRGSVGAVTAAILTGEEWHVGPMTSLAHIFVIDGRPTPSAHLQSSLIRREGHEIEPVEQTNTRCVLRCRRRGTDRWFEFGYTMDDAKQAGLAGKKTWRENPQDMLFARALGRAARRLFSDVVMGMPYNADELRDGLADDAAQGSDGPADAPAAITAPARTAQRRTRTQTAELPETATRPLPLAEPVQPDESLPPLPGEPGYADGPQTIAESPTETPPPVTPAQLKKLHTVFTMQGVVERDEVLTICGEVVGRKIDSTKDITKAEAGTVIDTLERLAASGQDFTTWLADLFAANEPNDKETR